MSQQPLMQQIQAVWGELPGLVGDRVELFSLELQRAGLALIQVVVLVVACGILSVTAWLVLWGGIVAGLVALGLHVALALLLVLALNAGAAWWAMARVRKLLVLLTLPGTRRHLTGAVTTSDDPIAPLRANDPRHPLAGEPNAP